MRKSLTLLTLLMLLLAQLYAQTRRITGRVVDDKGNPITNVSVVVRGGSGTVTDANGTFSIAVSPTSRVIDFSSLNYAPQAVTIGDRTELAVTMASSDRNLEEVVVVGYGTQRRTELTGNIAQISGSKLRDQPIQSFEQGLSGRAAGVNISIPNGVLGNAPVIRVRGVNSISLSSYPLVVIDGVPSFTGDVGSGSSANNLLGDINPSDIESVEVLKDASAAAIYGSRASAGVLIITTKKGRQGRARVNYEAWTGWTNPYNLIEVLNAQEFTDLKNEGLANAGTPANGTTRGFYTMNDAAGKLVDTRWYDHIYRTGFSHNHTVSISGANDKTNYYFSTGFTNQEGMFKNNSFKRLTGRFTLDHKVNDWLTFGGTFNYTNSENEGLNTGSTGAAFNTSGAARLAFGLAPNVGPLNADGSYNISGNNTIGQGNNISAVTFSNPVMLLDLNRFVSKSDRVLANVYGQVRLFRGLSFRSLYGIDNLSVVNEDFRNALHGDGQQFAGGAQNTLQRPRRWNWSNTLTYDTRIMDDHGLNILLGAEQQYTKTDRWGADRRNLADPFFNEFQGGFVDMTLPASPFIPQLSENFLQSYFGRINYDYKKKYLLSANLRRDGYSAFSNKWGTFYGGSAGWAVSEEEFWKNSALGNVVNSLRFRGSYGMVGNFAGIGDYAYQGLYSTGLYGANATVFFNQASNANLTWEKSKKLDIGFNAGLLKNRLSVEFAYYKNDITDLVLFEPQAPSRGIPTPTNVPANSLLTNVGSMVNKGFELTLNGTIVSSKEFSWTSNFNITTLKNEVLTLSNNNADVLVATGGLESPSLIRVGESLGSFYAVPTEGVNPANGRRIFVLNDGTRVQYNHAAASASRWTRVDTEANSRPANQATDARVIGPALPKYFGGFDNTFRYRGFDLNILLYFSGGNYVYNGSKAGLHDNRNWNNAKDALNRWTKAGENAMWPKVVFGDNVSNGSSMVISNNVEKGDFIKGRNISLGYTFPKTLVDRAGLNNVRLYASVLNAFTITKYSGFDPEIQSNNGAANTGGEQVVNSAPSVDRNAAPLARTINLGINIGF
ncbi:TonB-dependent receptor [Segetibacter sp. 3557_3]|uniref:SusC/RagA family TonB-linked outer membrane protein n=1 Tax=Segetibacter sp. 3557_3 TaxID=2547429 RepID=UPI001058ECF8|nr:TonB-dependent receptor [Segetibacter sp. 3557_3]TDH24052.1 TonB-dependent receptor [Segetibacter sp. 3557_3]